MSQTPLADGVTLSVDDAEPQPERVPVLLQRLDPGLPLPHYAHPGDAGADLCTAIDVTLQPGERQTVPTGIAIALPIGFAGLVHPRSGLAARHGLTIVNAPGTVDAGYRGELQVTLLNTDRDEPIVLRRGDRIAQLVVQRVSQADFTEVEQLPQSPRGAGGFGSTGDSDPVTGKEMDSELVTPAQAAAGVTGMGGGVPGDASGPAPGAPEDDLFPGTSRGPEWGEPSPSSGRSSDPGFGADSGADSETAADQGPWDVSDHPELDGLVDLGGLRVPGADGMALGLQVEEETGRLIGVTIELGGSSVQLQAFAAPRTDGIWAEIRTEIAASVTKQGGTADHTDGPFGTELLARIPNRAPDGSTSHQAVRFAGVDGPRWFLRAVFQGAAAYQPEAARGLEDFVKGVVVVRGGEAMAPRELLTLTLPEGTDQNGAGQDGADGAEQEATPVLRPPQRGPEITEVR